VKGFDGEKAEFIEFQPNYSKGAMLTVVSTYYMTVDLKRFAGKYRVQNLVDILCQAFKNSDFI
jgi:hypothetical protein